jgi:hypothetical protein
MPLLRYFLTVGTILTCGLFILHAYLEPVSDAAARVSVTPTTATLLVFAPAPKKPK